MGLVLEVVLVVLLCVAALVGTVGAILATKANGALLSTLMVSGMGNSVLSMTIIYQVPRSL